MSYKRGFCSQCLGKVLVQDVNGLFSSFKPNYREATLFFPDGHRMRVPICTGCLENIDYGKIIENLTHEESQAFPEETREFIKEKSDHKDIGIPTSHVQIALGTGRMLNRKGGANGS